MKPIVSTPETRRRAVVTRAAAVAADVRAIPHARENAALIVALGPDATAAAIGAAAPNAWRIEPTERCNACGEDVARVVTVGAAMEDWQTETATLCRPCLLAALAALDAAP